MGSRMQVGVQNDNKGEVSRVVGIANTAPVSAIPCSRRFSQIPFRI